MYFFMVGLARMSAFESDEISPGEMQLTVMPRPEFLGKRDCKGLHPGFAHGVDDVLRQCGRRAFGTHSICRPHTWIA